MHSPTPFLITILSLLLTLSLAACKHTHQTPFPFFSNLHFPPPQSHNPPPLARSRLPNHTYYIYDIWLTLFFLHIPSADFILQMHMFLQQYHHPTERASTRAITAAAAAVYVPTSFVTYP